MTARSSSEVRAGIGNAPVWSATLTREDSSRGPAIVWFGSGVFQPDRGLTGSRRPYGAAPPILLLTQDCVRSPTPQTTTCLWGSRLARTCPGLTSFGPYWAICAARCRTADGWPGKGSCDLCPKSSRRSFSHHPLTENVRGPVRSG